MHQGPDIVSAQPAAPEVSCLKITRRFSEAELVKTIMIMIAPEKDIDYRTIAVRVRADSGAAYIVVASGRRVIGEAEDTVRAGGGEVLVGLRVIAARRVIAVGDPAEIVEGGKLADQC